MIRRRPRPKPSSRSRIRVPTGLDDYLEQAKKKGHIVGTWGFDSGVDFTRMSKDESNVWFFEQVFNFLRAMFGLVVPDNLEVTAYNASEQITRDNLNQMTFLDEFMLVLKKLKQPLWVSRLNLNIVGFLRTESDPDNPIRIQIQEPASFIIWGGPDETGFQTFSISYRLFSEQKLQGEHNLLWSLNQPLLEKGLKKWEAQSGHRINVVEGNSDDLPLYRHGFSKPAPRRARPRPTPKREEPVIVDEGIPSLDDFDF
ncbi:MAG: hypothetical protein ABIE74_06285 [Pseudomonadota bacterium]